MPDEAVLVPGLVDPTMGEQSTQALRLIATVLGHDPTPTAAEALSWRERVVLTIACDALGLDDPVV
jgi:hypothetical protein